MTGLINGKEAGPQVLELLLQQGLLFIGGASAWMDR
jgi:hypothetical protein